MNLTYPITAIGVCLHLLVPPLAQHCLCSAPCLNMATSTTAQKHGRTFKREKCPVIYFHPKNRGGHILEGGPIFKRNSFVLPN